MVGDSFFVAGPFSASLTGSDVMASSTARTAPMKPTAVSNFYLQFKISPRVTAHRRSRAGPVICLCLCPATRGPLFCLNGTRCSDDEACVLDSERCDGFLDCSDHSDEDNCTCTCVRIICWLGWYKRSPELGFKCVSLFEQCSGATCWPLLYISGRVVSMVKSLFVSLPVDSLTYKVQNLQWMPDFFGAITLTWSRPKNLPLHSCSFLIYYR